MNIRPLLCSNALPMKLIAIQILLSDVVSFEAFAKKDDVQAILDKLVTSSVKKEEVKNDSTAMFSQEPEFKKWIPVTGIITNVHTSEPVIGATVAIKGKKKAVITDNEGKFSIDGDPGDILIISSVGYLPVELTIRSETSYTVKLTANEGNLQNITVVGSRGKPRTDVNRPVPVDVIGSKEMESTGQVDLGQMAQFTSPSFNSAKNGINGVANFADPATLRGMSPDQSLVLINGKRKHQFLP